MSLEMEPEKKSELTSHPLWEQYLEAQNLIIELRPDAEDGNDIANERIINLEERLSMLTEKIAKDLGIN